VNILALGLIVLITRVVHPIQTVIIVAGVMGRNFKEYYLQLVDKEHFVQFGKEYALLMIISIFESTAIKFFPWLDNDLIRVSGGYPNPFVFKLIGYGKVISATISIIVQIIVLVVVSIQNDKIILCELLLSVTLTSSILLLFITSLELYFQSSGLSTISIPVLIAKLTTKNLGAATNTDNDKNRLSSVDRIEVSSSIGSMGSFISVGRESSMELRKVKKSDPNNILEYIANPVSDNDTSLTAALTSSSSSSSSSTTTATVNRITEVLNPIYP
jgi:hypothetical protein